MKVVQSVALGVASLGSAVALVAGYLIVRGPFLGEAILDPRPLLVALVVFIVGITTGAWGVTTYARERA